MEVTSPVGKLTTIFQTDVLIGSRRIFGRVTPFQFVPKSVSALKSNDVSSQLSPSAAKNAI